MVRKLTAVLMVLAIAATVWVAWMLPRQPLASAPRRIRRAYAVTMLSASGGIVVCLLAAAVGASIVSRQAKRDYREAAVRNLRSLVEGNEGQGTRDK